MPSRPSSLATALDRCDYAAAAAVLAADCEYVTPSGLITGPSAIVASYRQHDQWAKASIESVEYQSVVRLDGDQAVVTFVDNLRHRGAAHVYRCEQHVHVAGGLVRRIEHREIPGEREAVDAWLEAVGVSRGEVSQRVADRNFVRTGKSWAWNGGSD